MAALALLAGVAWLSRDALRLGLAFSAAESRPALLRDARWDEEASARLFGRRFRSGVASAELLSWLNENRFDVDRAAARASRRIAALPCNERVEVRWAADKDGRLTRASALVHEAGCL